MLDRCNKPVESAETKQYLLSDIVNNFKSPTPDELLGKYKMGDFPLFYYITATIGYKEGANSFIQTGSAPNFQGGLITLCTCKHSMRATARGKKKPGEVWIAGITGKNVIGSSHYLVWLAQLKQRCQSFRDLWGVLPPDARKAKNMRCNFLGDVLEPKAAHGKSPYDLSDYELPNKGGHSHFDKKGDGLEDDVNYKYRGNDRFRPDYWIFDSAHSFVWSTPTIHLSTSLTQGHKETTLADFIGILKMKKGQ